MVLKSLTDNLNLSFLFCVHSIYINEERLNIRNTAIQLKTKELQQKLNIISFMKGGFIAGLLYEPALALARCT